MLIQILIPVAAMAALGLIFGVGLAYALKLFGIEVDPLTFQILSKLPGSNCGACGRAGCAGFAEALRRGEAMPSGCVVSNDEARKAIAKLIGAADVSKEKRIASALCNGGTRAIDKFIYRGIKTCKADSLIFGGHKACFFGCLGWGDCARACPFGAITMSAAGLPEVDAARCTACGNCIKACPKGLFELIPERNKFYVKCRSTDTGAMTAKVCKGGCIACMKCEKACPVQAAKVESNLARIDYAKCENTGKCFEACPTGVIHLRVNSVSGR